MDHSRSFLPTVVWMTNKNKEKLCALRGAKKHQKQETMNNKEIWSKILNIVITVLTAIATTFGVTSCMGV